MFVLGLFLEGVHGLSFGDRFVITFGAVLLSTLISFIATLILGARQRAQILASGRPLAKGHVPGWFFPLILGILVTLSAGVAYVA